MPAITAPVAIDGSTQPNIGSSGLIHPRIILDGQDSVASGIVIEQSGGGSQVIELALHRFVESAIVIRSSNNIVLGNYIGIDPGSDAPRPNGSGILLLGMAGAPASNNVIGRSTVSNERNRIGASRGDALVIRATAPGAADANVLGRNEIGLGQSASVVIPNGGNGLLLENTTNTTIHNNVIAASGANGIYLLGAQGTSGDLIASGIRTRAGNALSGLRIESTTLSPANNNVFVNSVFERNGDSGVRVISGTGNRISQFQMSGNTPLAIDLGPAGETPNDACDLDVGANLLQNKPVLGEQTTGSGIVSGTGSLIGAPSSTYTIEFYANRFASTQGELYLGSTTVTTDATCMATFTYNFAAASPSWVAATATDAAGNTSELAAVPPSTMALQVTKSFTPTQITHPASSRLTVRITDPRGVATSEIAFVDTLPANLVLASDPAVTNTCGGTVTAQAGQTSFSLANGTTPANTPCAVTVSVVATVDGTFTNTLPAGSVTANGSFNTAPASATLQVLQPAPSVAKTFTPSNVAVGQPTRLTITLTAMSNVAVTNVAFTDTYPAGLANASNPQAATTCGGTVTAAPNGSSLALSGGTIPANGSCTVSAFVIATTAGTSPTKSPPARSPVRTHSRMPPPARAFSPPHIRRPSPPSASGRC